MSLILALDQGTTSSRAILFDREGNVRAIAQKEFEQIYPEPAWVEHDPETLWSSQIGVASEALARAQIGPRDLAAIGITNQRETTLVWDRATGQPIHNAIVWQDRRTAAMCERLEADGCANMIRDKTGLVLDAYFSASKISWILEHVPEARQRAASGALAFGTVDSWLAYKLTDGRLHVTDPSNASRTLLFNIQTGDWDRELLELFGVPEEMMPRVCESSEVFGEASTHTLEGVPIAAIAGDQQAALFGQLCLERGLTKSTYGTGCFVLANTGTEPVVSDHKLLTTVAWKCGGRTHYALEGSVFIGGAVVQWLRDGLGIIRSAPDVERLANTVEDNGGVYLVPAFTGLGAPHWNPHARGIIAGITRGTTAGHIARAALEGIAFQVADLLDAMHSDAAANIAELRVDGGAANNDTLMQFQADILRAPVVRPTVTETTALGAAYLAGLAVGYWKDPTELATHWQIDRRFDPQMNDDRVVDMRNQWASAVDRAKDWQPRN